MFILSETECHICSYILLHLFSQGYAISLSMLFILLPGKVFGGLALYVSILSKGLSAAGYDTVITRTLAEVKEDKVSVCGTSQGRNGGYTPQSLHERVFVSKYRSCSLDDLTNVNRPLVYK